MFPNALHPNAHTPAWLPALIIVWLPVKKTVVPAPRNPVLRVQLTPGGLAESPVASVVAQPTTAKRRNAKEPGTEEQDTSIAALSPTNFMY
jgi:hypothetical protein